MDKAATYKLEFRTWNGAAYVWTDYSSYLVSSDSIAHKLDSGNLPNSFTATMGKIVVDNSTSFWSTGMDAKLINSSEPYGKSFRKRRVRLSAVETNIEGVETTVYLFTGSVDDIIYDNQTGKATISVISLDRIAMEQMCDADKINDNTIGGAWAAKMLYEGRTKNDNTGEFNYTWFQDRNAYDILTHISEALDDAGCSHEAIALTTKDSRRVCTTRESLLNTALTGLTVYSTFWSPLHGCFIIAVSDGATPSHTKLYSYDRTTNALTLRWTGADYTEEAYAWWYNSVSAKVFFIQQEGATPDYYLCQLNADWSVNRQQIVKTGFAGNVTYSQARNGGNGSIFISTHASKHIIEFACSNISGSLSELNDSTQSVDAYKMAVNAAGTRLIFVSPFDSTTDDLYVADISGAVSWAEFFLIDETSGYCDDALYYDSDYLFYINRQTATFDNYKIKAVTNADIEDCLLYGVPVAPSTVYSSAEAYRVLQGFRRAADGLYFVETSLFGESAANPSKPTYLLSIKDTDKTAAVYENKIDVSAVYGEFIVDGELGLNCLSSKVAGKYGFFYFGLSYNPATAWEFWGLTNTNKIIFQFSKELTPYIRLCDFSELSAWDLRKKIAEMLNAVIYYDTDGTFKLKKRPVSGTANYTITSPRLALVTAGYKNIKNAIYSIPYHLPFAQIPPVEIEPWSVTKVASTISLSKIILGRATTNTSRWRFRFTSTTAFAVEEETAAGTWTARTTGTVGTNLVYNLSTTFQMSINGADWTGTAAIGDEILFWSRKTQKQLVKGLNMERMEQRDATSIAANQKTETSFDNRFVPKLLLMDILYNILQYWKNAHQVINCKTEYNSAYQIFTKLAFAETTMAITTAKIWNITSIKRAAGDPQMDIELTEI